MDTKPSTIGQATLTSTLGATTATSGTTSGVTTTQVAYTPVVEDQLTFPLFNERRLIFLDTETTHLHPKIRRAWDVAYIIREGGQDSEHQSFIDVDLSEADPMSLKIGRYWERHPDPYGHHRKHPELSVCYKIARDFKDAIVVGAVPDFDSQTLADLLYANGLLPTWHYHLVDVETLAAGAKGIRPPWNFDKILAEFDLSQNGDRHTAIGDARLVRDLYDAVYRT